MRSNARVVPLHVLDLEACRDVLLSMAADGVLQNFQELALWKAILARTDAETRITQPGVEQALIPELLEASGVSRSYLFKFMDAFGARRDPVEPWHLFRRIRILPNGSFPVDNRYTSYGGVALELLFESAKELAEKRVLGGSDLVDRGPRRGPRSTAWTSVHAMDLLDRRSQDPDLDPDLLNPDLKSPPPPRRARAERANAVAPAAPGLATPAEPAGRDKRHALRAGVSRQHSTTSSRTHDAPGEGQKSRGARAHAPAPSASDTPRKREPRPQCRTDEPGTLRERMDAALEHFRRRLAPRRKTDAQPWTPDELLLVRDALCAPRGPDGKGWPLVQLLLTVEGCARSLHNDRDPARRTVRAVFGTDDRIEGMAAVARNGGVDVSRWLLKGPEAPERVYASDDQWRTRGQRKESNVGSGLDGTEHASYATGEEAEAVTTLRRTLGIEDPGGVKKGSTAR